MFSRLFSPISLSRIFDPMPLPKRVRVTVGRYRAPSNRIASATSYNALFARKIKRIPTNR